MTENRDNRGAQLEEALAAAQREERDEQGAAIARQQQVDEAVADHLARAPQPNNWGE